MGTRLVSGDVLHLTKEAAIFTWSPRNPAQSRSSLRRQKKYYDVWDLDGGVPRFVRHTKRVRLKLIVDSDGDGLFTRLMLWLVVHESSAPSAARVAEGCWRTTRLEPS